MDGGWMKYKLKVEKFSEERGGSQVASENVMVISFSVVFSVCVYLMVFAKVKTLKTT